MSTGAHSFSTSPRDRELLGELLHSLSQPLTSLRCSLELSIGELAEQQQQTVSAALQQTEIVIGMIQLLREYLDAEPVATNCMAALAPALRSVCDDLASIAAVHDVRLRLVGTCAAELRVAEPRLRRALQYLILTMIAQQPARGEITLTLGEGPPGAVLRAQIDRSSSHPESSTGNSRPNRDSVQETMRRARLAIAVRVLETGGARLAFDDGASGFVLRVPHQSGAFV